MENHTFKAGDRVEIKKSTFVGKIFFEGKILSINALGECVVRCEEAFKGAAVGATYKCLVIDISRLILAS